MSDRSLIDGVDWTGGAGVFRLEELCKFHRRREQGWSNAELSGLGQRIDPAHEPDGVL